MLDFVDSKDLASTLWRLALKTGHDNHHGAHEQKQELYSGEALLFAYTYRPEGSAPMTVKAHRSQCQNITQYSGQYSYIVRPTALDSCDVDFGMDTVLEELAAHVRLWRQA